MMVRSATVTRIEETRAYFDNAGRPEYLDLLEMESATAELGALRVERPAPPGNDLGSKLAAGIKKTGDWSYDIDRSALDAVLGNLSLLRSSVRIVQEVRDGKPAGFRLSGVRSDGPFARIGLRDGDVIYAINGLEMTGPEQALEAYGNWRGNEKW